MQVCVMNRSITPGSRRWLRVLPAWLGAAFVLGLGDGLEGSTRKDAIGSFSDAEIRALYASTGDSVSRAQAPLVAEFGGDPIELEAYVVKGDPTLLLAAVRRYLELGPLSVRMRVAELSPVLDRQVQFSGRAGEQFFLASAPGRPADAPALIQVDQGDLRAVGRMVSNAVRKVVPPR
jgi:hypothetical protein